MALPEFDSRGDLPEGVHRATLDEVLARFGHGTPQRVVVTARLLRTYELVLRTNKLDRFIIYGSYVTDKPYPGDVDIILVMRDDFLLPECDDEVGAVFDHPRAQAELGASIFWTLRSGVLLETLDDFIAGWQIKRDQSQRGIVEMREKQR
jgi:hypothetical protein